MKYIFVVGGVMSGVGKGIATASLGKILQARGKRVTALKIDPYINVDAGTMNPTEHGEVFVLRDGYETDQDMGNYERFLDKDLPNENYMTTGRVYQAVIERERNLEYHGKCVEVVPHIPLEVLDRIKRAGRKARAEIVLVEIGGTIGEYQNILFLEAVRMLKVAEPQNVLTVMVSYVPIPSKVGEAKTKPTQYAVRTLNSTGIQPDFIIARSERPLDAKRRQKISLFCSVPESHVISAPDVETVYEVPLLFEKEDLSRKILEALHVRRKGRSNLQPWRRMVARSKKAQKRIRIGIVGKYFSTGDFVLTDAYISVIEAVRHAATSLGRKAEILWLESERYEKNPQRLRELCDLQGIIVPGGFGTRGIEGKIAVARFCRQRRLPYLGICYGMQLLVVEYARSVCGMKGAHTQEVDARTPYPIVAILEEQKKHLSQGRYGGTMRLGAYPAHLKKGTLAAEAYGKARIEERHRHRYEINPRFVKTLEEHGLRFSGVSPDGKLMEIAELPQEKHPFYVGTQFHPELQSRPLRPHPLFVRFLEAADAFRCSGEEAGKESR